MEHELHAACCMLLLLLLLLLLLHWEQVSQGSQSMAVLHASMRCCRAPQCLHGGVWRLSVLKAFNISMHAWQPEIS